jgi:hypothetical protein
MNNEQDILKDEVKKLTALQDVAHLEGVQLLVSHTKNTVKNCIDILANQYVEKSESELKALCSTLRANLEIYQLMTGLADKIEAIDEALK